MPDAPALQIYLNIAHNVVLFLCYAALGTVYFQAFAKRLGIPEELKWPFAISARVFFIFCAYTHLELLIHSDDLPQEFFTWSHNTLGMTQAIAAVGFIVILHAITYNKRLKIPKIDTKQEEHEE